MCALCKFDSLIPGEIRIGKTMRGNGRRSTTVGPFFSYFSHMKEMIYISAKQKRCKAYGIYIVAATIPGMLTAK